MQNHTGVQYEGRHDTLLDPYTWWERKNASSCRSLCFNRCCVISAVNATSQAQAVHLLVSKRLSL